MILSGISGTGKTKLVQHFASLLPQPMDVGLDPVANAADGSTAIAAGATTAKTWLFLAVRPDWRDTRSLLGYYNPLTEQYEWTPFLQFLVQAAESYDREDRLAWFVILDEMNLAHVEHYFADLLSVLESGRNEEGYTREAVRLVYPAGLAGAPPAEIYLPPNLYVVGTVNMDETTHAFSPKVLDRAFTVELSDVDFEAYPPPVGEDPQAIASDERFALLDAFSRGRRFAYIDKSAVARHLATHRDIRDCLTSLNMALRPFGLHFGYRVFDEIVCFAEAAQKNEFFAEVAGADPAFDAAVLIKVLPKFHGSRGKLEAPLLAVLGWCLAPTAPDIATIRSLWDQADGESDPTHRLRGLDFRLPRTAARVIRMLYELDTDGFTSFG